MQHSDKGFGKEEALERELTETDLATIYGGAKGGSGTPTFSGPPGNVTIPGGLSWAELAKLAEASSQTTVPATTVIPSTTAAPTAPSTSASTPVNPNPLAGGLSGLLGSLGL